MHLRPQDLPDLRAETVDYVARLGQPTYERSITHGRQMWQPAGCSPSTAARMLAAAELRRLTHAELFHVSADMTELAIAAAATLPEFTLMPEDIPAPTGLIYFDRPIHTYDAQNDDGSPAGSSPIVAATWSPWTGGNPDWTYGGIWVTWYADRGAIIETGIRLNLPHSRQAQALLRTPGRILIDNETQCPFSPEVIPSVRPDGTSSNSLHEAGGVAQWLGILKTTWLLMTQPVTTVADAVYDRAARRRLPKGQEPQRVRVITLRRPASAGSGDTTESTYKHQWLVRGHWRQAWYPSRNVHRPVWIAPHLKGPEGAPFLGAEKVHAWTR
jgi:hypothetical protein